MNLAALAALVCKRVGLVQPKDVTACEGFLTFRHDQLYRSKLWKDSLVEYQLPYDPNAFYLPNSAYLPTQGVVLLPPIIAHVLSARTSQHKLDVERPMLYYRVDQDQFAKTGVALNFFLLSACVWATDTPDFLFDAIAANNADNQLVVSVDISDPTDLVSITRSTLTPVAGTAGPTDRIETALKPASQGQISLVAGKGFNVLTLANSSSQPVTFNVSYINQGLPVVNIVTVQPGQTSVGSIGTTVAVPALGLTANPPGGLAFSGYAICDGTQITFVANPTILNLQPADTEAPKRQRIRLLDIPSQADTIRVLGKRTVPPFASDNDTPGVSGMEAPLMALAYYDMLHRDERGGSKEASDALEEAAGLLKQLEAEEVTQGASNSRIMPESGFGPDEYYVGPIF